MPRLRQRPRRPAVLGAGCGERRVQLRRALGRVLDVVQIAPQPLGGRKHVVERRPVFLLQTFEGRQAVLHLLKARGGRIDVSGVGAKKEREILELRLDRLPAVQVCGESSIERCEIADSPPHDAERRERGVVSVVQRRVRLIAEPLQLVRIDEHGARRRELVVLAARGREAVDLGELKANELGARGLLAFARLQPLAFGADLLPRGEGVRRFAAQLREAAEGVEQIEVRRGIEQLLVLVLSVQIDEAAARVA